MAKKRGLGRGLDALLGIESGGSGVGKSTPSDLSELSVEVIDAEDISLEDLCPLKSLKSWFINKGPRHCPAYSCPCE